MEKFSPTPIKDLYAFFRYAIRGYHGINFVYALRKNLSYNFQYLEYLSYSIKKYPLTDVLQRMSYKNFIIVGMGMIEAILYYKIIENNRHKNNCWEHIREVKGNEFKVNGEIFRIHHNIYKKSANPIEEEIKLHTMLHKIEDEKLLGNDHGIYGKLNRLRKLRNKIHMHMPEHNTDHDYNAFASKDYNLIIISLL